jgi:photosystem II stability/assembly factor-like uncharacterized protein
MSSKDGGKTWNRQDWKTVRNLFKIDFCDENNGIIAGGNGDLFVTGDNGKTWSRKVSPKAFAIRNALYLDSKTITAIGQGDAMLRSNDAGATWNCIKLPGIYSLWGLAYNRTAKTGFACGYGDNGVILKTTDGGLTWKQVYTFKDEIALLYDISFADDNTIFAVGGTSSKKNILMSKDCGETWNKIETENLGLTWNEIPEKVVFTDSRHGLIAGHGGLLLRSEDGGASWKRLRWSSNPDRNGELDLDGMEFSDSRTGYITGASGLILKTTDGGETWTELSQRSVRALGAITFCSPLDGAAAGINSTVYITKDGGKNWIDRSPGTSAYGLSIVKMPGKNHVVSAGFNVTLPCMNIIYVTKDGGSSWSTSHAGDNVFIRDIGFFDDNNGILIGYNVTNSAVSTTAGVIYKTTDGGLSWSLMSFIFDDQGQFPPCSIQVMSVTKAMLMGEFGSVYSTDDMGTTWKYISSLPQNGTVCSMHFADEKTGYAAALSGIYKTVDGGKNWTMKFNANYPCNTVSSIHFCDKNNGYAVGEGGVSPNYSLILRTTDGGETWNYEFPPTVCRLASVYVVNDTVSYAAGEGSVIISTLRTSASSSVNDEIKKPAEFHLSQNYPNPFNPSTVIEYQIPTAGRVKIAVYNVLGKEVAVLADSDQPAGSHKVVFNASGLSSGVYFYTVSSGNMRKTGKMMLMK